MTRQSWWLVVAAAAALAACSGETTAPITVSEKGAANGEGPGETSSLVVMTRNMYVGADVDAVIAAIANTDPSDDLPALTTAIQTFAATDVATRATGFAAEIARTRPHAVGLQEVSKIEIDLRPLGMNVVIHANFLAALQQALAARGLPYVVAARVANFTAKPPLPGGAVVSLSDDDALLVDASRVRVLGSMGGNFAYNLGRVAEGVELRRGWVAARVKIDGLDYLIASTHLESNLGLVPGIDQLRAAQMQELVGRLFEFKRVVIMGDLNDDRGSLMYQLLQSTGYTDLWMALRPEVLGLTCCHDPTLGNPEPTFTQVRDYVFTRGTGSGGGGVDLIGVKRWERLAGPFYPIWPSDHAGIVARLVTLRDWVADR